MSIQWRGENQYSCLTCGYSMTSHTAYCPNCESLKAQQAMAENSRKAAEAASEQAYQANRANRPEVEIIYTPALTKEQYASEVAREKVYHQESVKRGTVLGIVNILIGLGIFGYMASGGVLGAIMGGLFAVFFIFFGSIFMS